MSERYVVRSVTGWSIIPSGASSRRPGTIWSVHDSAICYQTVSVGSNAWWGGERGERRARELAARMNAEDDAYLKESA